MYESMTFDYIMNSMIDAVINNDATIDTREGSLIYNAIAPAAAELAQMYIAIDAFLNESFVDTASRSYLIKRCAERGITPEPASYAILKGEFNIDVELGSRFSLDNLTYIVEESISTGVFKVQCETVGVVGNTKLGKIVPIDYIEGLTSAELIEVLVPGQDEEDTEILRQRYYNTLSSQAFGGNVADYKEKTNKLIGVGSVKVYPVWNGGGTVKLVILNSSYGQPSETLINETQEAVNEFAPIGHVVTIEGALVDEIDIVTTITYNEGYEWEDLESYVFSVIDSYYLELSETWEDNDNLIVRISQIETRLLNIQGILDIESTLINNSASNYVVGENYIPIRGKVNGNG